MELKSRSFTSKEPHVAREPQVADPCHSAAGRIRGLLLKSCERSYPNFATVNWFSARKLYF
jgi:hypothetical protein